MKKQQMELGKTLSSHLNDLKYEETRAKQKKIELFSLKKRMRKIEHKDQVNMKKYI